MTEISKELVAEAVELLGTDGLSAEDIEVRVSERVADAMIARRLIDVIPEAFGFTFLAKMMPEVKLPSYFLAKNAKDRWINIAFSREPIFTFALQVADKMLREGPREKFEAISLRSSMVNTVNNALKQGANLAGAMLSPPAFIGIPAEAYPQAEISLLQKLAWWR